MAKRRALARALAGLGQGIGNASNMWMQQIQRERLQDRYDQRAEESAKASAARANQAELDRVEREIRMKVAAGEIDPGQAAVMLSQLTNTAVAPAALEPIRPSLTRRLGKKFDPMMDSPFPEGLPTDAELIAEAKAQGGELPPEFPGIDPSWLVDTPPSADQFARFAPEVQSYARGVNARRRALQSRPTERIEKKGMTPDEPTTIDFVSPYESDNIPVGPSASQQGVLEGAQEVGKQTTILGNDAFQKLKGEAEARMTNLVEALTRQAKVATAAAISGATKRAELAPDIVSAEVDRAQRLAEGKDQSTESERRAATNWAPLVNAHASAIEMETNGASIGLLDPTLSKWPVANRAISAQSQQYMQAARDFISTLGLIRSGVTVRPDEAESLFATMFRMEGEGPQQLRNKQRSREVFLASMQAMVGRSGDEAGRILAEAINRGQINPSVLQSLQFENQQLRDALLKNLRGVPMFDINGNPIGVRQ